MINDPTLPPEMGERMGDGQWQLVWPGLDGIPYRTKDGNIPTVKEDDPNGIRPQLKNEVSVKIFDLGDPDSLKEYESVLNMCADGLGRVMSEDTQYDPETCKWRVLLTWTKYFYESPSESKREQSKYYQ